MSSRYTARYFKVKLKPSFKVRLSSEVPDAEDYDTIVPIFGVEYNGSFLFCWDEVLHVAPLNINGSVRLSEASPVTDYESPEELETLKKIARKLGCRLAIPV